MSFVRVWCSYSTSGKLNTRVYTQPGCSKLVGQVWKPHASQTLTDNFPIKINHFGHYHFVKIKQIYLSLPDCSSRPIAQYTEWPIVSPSRPIHLNVHVEFDPGMVGKGVLRCYMTSSRQRSFLTLMVISKMSLSSLTEKVLRWLHIFLVFDHKHASFLLLLLDVVETIFERSQKDVGQISWRFTLEMMTKKCLFKYVLQ